mmetsp:Transcript_4985/g.7905  ORF Transcript_4985/g.7905 Transcript_4985/m.7905 type:complete len:290 (-) Transcript_4985:24-893(-)
MDTNSSSDSLPSLSASKMLKQNRSFSGSDPRQHDDMPTMNSFRSTTPSLLESNAAKIRSKSSSGVSRKRSRSLALDTTRPVESASSLLYWFCSSPTSFSSKCVASAMLMPRPRLFSHMLGLPSLVRPRFRTGMDSGITSTPVSGFMLKIQVTSPGVIVSLAHSRNSANVISRLARSLLSLFASPWPLFFFFPWNAASVSSLSARTLRLPTWAICSESSVSSSKHIISYISSLLRLFDMFESMRLKRSRSFSSSVPFRITAMPARKASLLNGGAGWCWRRDCGKGSVSLS